MSAATKTAPSTNGTDEATKQRLTLQKEMGGPRGVASYVSDELRTQSSKLSALTRQIFLLANAVSYLNIECYLSHHPEAEHHFTADLDPRDEEKKEALCRIAEEVDKKSSQLSKMGLALKNPDESLKKTAWLISQQLQEMSDRLEDCDDKIDTTRKALMYTIARQHLSKAERKHGDSARVFERDLQTAMESEPVVKRLDTLSWELFDHGGWLIEMSRRLRLAFPKEEG